MLPGSAKLGTLALSMSPRLELALAAARRAGDLAFHHFLRGASVEFKPDSSPVTIADREAERLVRDMIAERFPGEEILGEEEGGQPTSGSYWVIDPIDGTKSFICGVPLFATLVSYERDGEPRVGVAYFPALQEIVYAEAGLGCYWNGAPCRVSRKARIEESVLSCGSHASMRAAGRDGPFLKLAMRALATRTWTDAFGHALVATGRIEAMVDPVLNYWDISAMKLIVREAGGKFTDFEGGPSPADQAISSNGLIHNLLVETFRG